MARMEAMDNHELREYMLQKKGTLESQMKTTIKKVSCNWYILLGFYFVTMKAPLL